MATIQHGLSLKSTSDPLGFGPVMLNGSTSGVTIYCHFDSDVPSQLQDAIRAAADAIQSAMNVTFDFDSTDPRSPADREITFRMDQAGYYDLSHIIDGAGNHHPAEGISFWSANPDSDPGGRPPVNHENDPGFTNSNNYLANKADVAFDSGWVQTALETAPDAAFQPGGFIYWTVLHEMSHALGLGHSQDAGLSDYEGNDVYTIMRGGLGTDGVTAHPLYIIPGAATTWPGGQADVDGFLNPLFTAHSTLGVYDLVALQSIWGKNDEDQTTTTYSWTKNEVSIKTIWDARAVPKM